MQLLVEISINCTQTLARICVLGAAQNLGKEEGKGRLAGAIRPNNRPGPDSGAWLQTITDPSQHGSAKRRQNVIGEGIRIIIVGYDVHGAIESRFDLEQLAQRSSANHLCPPVL